VSGFPSDHFGLVVVAFEAANEFMLGADLLGASK
jgi:hypothetical protein